MHCTLAQKETQRTRLRGSRLKCSSLGFRGCGCVEVDETWDQGRGGAWGETWDWGLQLHAGSPAQSREIVHDNADKGNWDNTLLMNGCGVV